MSVILLFLLLHSVSACGVVGLKGMRGYSEVEVRFHSARDKLLLHDNETAALTLMTQQNTNDIRDIFYVLDHTVERLDHTVERLVSRCDRLAEQVETLERNQLFATSVGLMGMGAILFFAAAQRWWLTV